MRKLQFILFFLIFYQCTQPIINPINEPEKKLVISSFFTADTSMTVWVGYPHDILIDTLLHEANAMVKLYEDGQFIENLTHTSDGYYVSNYILKTGKTYKIEVETEELSASAEDMIPEQVLADSAFYEFIQLPDWEEYKKYEFKFQDIIAEKNYYEFQILSIFYDEGRNISDIGFVTDARNMDFILDNEDIDTYQPFSFFFKDDLIDGQRYQLKMEMENGVFSSTKFRITGKFMNSDANDFLLFRTISKTYYDFQKSWIRHRFNRNLGSRLENEVQLLFGNEAQPLFTNIVNGYGIFVAYQEQIIPFEE